jgi:SAM-dependent methyltransferase
MADRLFADAGLAALYDAFSANATRPDFGFYLPMVLASDSVLDVGCGTGALLHRARDAGHRGRLCGLDPAAGMLAQARKRTDVEWVLGDLESVDFDREFDLVVMTGHAFQVFTTDDEVRGALGSIRLALKNDGRFAFETRNPLKRDWERWTPEHPIEVLGARMERQVETTTGDLVTFSHTITGPHLDGPQVSRSTLRFLDPGRLAGFLTEAGLAVKAQFGDWEKGPLTEASPEIITVAEKMAG